MNKFTSEVSRNLKYYVYIYSHPVTGEIFYVGKGKGNRVFQHLNDKLESAKVLYIQDLENQGYSPKIEILIHGLDDEMTALRVESSVIDLIGIDNLTNKQSGYKSSTFGRMSIEQVKSLYEREPIEIDDKVVLIRVSQAFRYSMSDMELYDYTRGRWRVNPEKAGLAEYAFSVYEGVIQEVYEVLNWFPAGATFSLRNNDGVDSGRYEFVGNLAPDSIREKYRYKSVEHYFKKGNSNPIMYLNI